MACLLRQPAALAEKIGCLFCWAFRCSDCDVGGLMCLRHVRGTRGTLSCRVIVDYSR